MPDFTTTTDTDKVVCSVVMMATLQKYFSYKLCLECGIPSVTLLGERRDYENILKRLEKLLSFGEETGEWSQLLIVVLEYFLASFDAPGSKETKDFWQKNCAYVWRWERTYLPLWLDYGILLLGRERLQSTPKVI